MERLLSVKSDRAIDNLVKLIPEDVLYMSMFGSANNKWRMKELLIYKALLNINLHYS